MEGAQLTDSNQIVIPYPHDSSIWQHLAVSCVALANSGGGTIKINSSNRLNSLQLVRLSNRLHELIDDLDYVTLEYMETEINGYTSLKISPSNASLAKDFIKEVQKPQEGEQVEAVDNNLSVKIADFCRINTNILLNGVNSSEIPYLLFDESGTLTNINKAGCLILELTIKNGNTLTFEELFSEQIKPLVHGYFWNSVSREKSWQGEIFLNVTQNLDCRKPVEIALTRIIDRNTHSTSYFAQLRDLTAERSIIKSLNRLAFYDSVTGLANRALFKDRLGIALSSHRRQNLYGALLYIDLDNFKRINDVHGHSCGDAVLKKCGRVLSKDMRKEDTMARLGGDEFVALLTGFDSSYLSVQKQAIKIAQKMCQNLEPPLNIGEYKHYIKASIGITTFPKGLESAEDLLREADTAMYEAKAAGRNQVRLFEQGMFKAVSRRYEVEKELRTAITQNEFCTYLQVQVDASEKICSVESLIRWNHPERGIVPPLEFISIAEETGQIVPIGNWMLKNVCKIIKHTESQGKPLPISINVSARQFCETDFLEVVCNILREIDISNELLTIELTESLLIDDHEMMASVMYELSCLGVNFSIDDFGTGYSNLGYLRHLALKEIKIDRSFIAHIVDDKSDATVVEALLALAKHLNLEVVAEGVETREQANFLKSLSCDKMQGYLYGKPIPSEQFISTWLLEQ